MNFEMREMFSALSQRNERVDVPALVFFVLSDRSR